MGDIFISSTATWVEVLRPTYAGFYVPLLLAIIAGFLEAHAHRKPGAPVRYHREYFVVGVELCLGAISIVLLAAVDRLRAADGIFFEAFLTQKFPSVMLIPMLMVNVTVMWNLWLLRRDAIRGAPSALTHGFVQTDIPGKMSRISWHRVSGSTLVCAGLVGLNSLLFQQPP